MAVLTAKALSDKTDNTIDDQVVDNIIKAFGLQDVVENDEDFTKTTREALECFLNGMKHFKDNLLIEDEEYSFEKKKN